MKHFKLRTWLNVLVLAMLLSLAIYAGLSLYSHYEKYYLVFGTLVLLMVILFGASLFLEQFSLPDFFANDRISEKPSSDSDEARPSKGTAEKSSEKPASSGDIAQPSESKTNILAMLSPITNTWVWLLGVGFISLWVDYTLPEARLKDHLSDNRIVLGFFYENSYKIAVIVFGSLMADFIIRFLGLMMTVSSRTTESLEAIRNASDILIKNTDDLATQTVELKTQERELKQQSEILRGAADSTEGSVHSLEKVNEKLAEKVLQSIVDSSEYMVRAADLQEHETAVRTWADSHLKKKDKPSISKEDDAAEDVSIVVEIAHKTKAMSDNLINGRIKFGGNVRCNYLEAGGLIKLTTNTNASDWGQELEEVMRDTYIGLSGYSEFVKVQLRAFVGDLGERQFNPHGLFDLGPNIEHDDSEDNNWMETNFSGMAQIVSSLYENAEYIYRNICMDSHNGSYKLVLFTTLALPVERYLRSSKLTAGLRSLQTDWDMARAKTRKWQYEIQENSEWISREGAIYSLAKKSKEEKIEFRRCVLWLENDSEQINTDDRRDTKNEPGHGEGNRDRVDRKATNIKTRNEGIVSYDRWKASSDLQSGNVFYPITEPYERLSTQVISQLPYLGDWLERPPRQRGDDWDHLFESYSQAIEDAPMLSHLDFLMDRVIAKDNTSKKDEWIDNSLHYRHSKEAGVNPANPHIASIETKTDDFIHPSPACLFLDLYHPHREDCILLELNWQKVRDFLSGLAGIFSDANYASDDMPELAEVFPNNPEWKDLVAKATEGGDEAPEEWVPGFFNRHFPIDVFAIGVQPCSGGNIDWKSALCGYVGGDLNNMYLEWNDKRNCSGPDHIHGEGSAKWQVLTKYIDWLYSGGVDDNKPETLCDRCQKELNNTNVKEEFRARLQSALGCHANWDN